MKKAASWIPPNWLDTEAWAEFEAHRKDIKQPLTDRARALAVKKLKRLSKEAQRQTINRTVESGWTGLFPEKSAARPSPSSEPYKVERMSDAEWRKRQKSALERLRELKKSIV